MLRFFAPRWSHRAAGRREWLRIGLGSALAALSPRTTSRGATSNPARRRSPGFGKAKSVLLIYASGGQSQLDLWDPKPDAPEHVRGEFAAIPTCLPGVAFSEHLPGIARRLDRCSLIRTMSHDDLDHGSATYLALTGHFHARKSSNPPPTPNDLPTYGAVLKRVRPAKRFPYTAVHLNAPALVPTVPAAGQGAGLLGTSCEPLVLGDLTSETVALPGLAVLPDVPAVRQKARQSLLESLEETHRQLSSAPARQEMNELYRQAHRILADPRSRKAFDLDDEPASLRDRYGRHRPGAACLLARRLIEAGVPWITVVWSHSNRGQDRSPTDIDAYGWDTHNDIFDALKTWLLPRFDATLSALLDDLDDRGLLDQTLVVCMGEFGRAPLVALEPKFAGSSPGRKHWASAYSVLVAGGGTTRGQVVGRTDRFAGQPDSTPYSPGDLAATMFASLGVDPAGHFLDFSDRPYAIAEGQPIEALYHPG